MGIQYYNAVNLIGDCLEAPKPRRKLTVFTMGVKHPDSPKITQTVKIVSSGRLGEIITEYVKKDCKLLISGRLGFPGEVIAESVNVLKYNGGK